MAELLEIKNLSKNFHGLKAVSDVSFTVEKGSITGMIGSNGAGKTIPQNIRNNKILTKWNPVICKRVNEMNLYITFLHKHK